ncbi:MAG: hypothetical protein ACI9EF_003160 [Pseudohongiellaceae bacterium]
MRKFPVAPNPYHESYIQSALGFDISLWMDRLVRLPFAIFDATQRSHVSLFWAFVIVVAIPLGWKARGSARLLALALLTHLLLCLGLFVVTPDVMHWQVYNALLRLRAQRGVVAGLLVVHAAVRLWKPAEAIGPAIHGMEPRELSSQA